MITQQTWLALRHASKLQLKGTSRAISSCTIKPLTIPRAFSTTKQTKATNRILDNIRSADDFSTALLLSTSTSKPLLTLWTTSWCSTCRALTPLIRSLLEQDEIGTAQGGVSFAEVELDSPTIGEVASRYVITSVPTLLAFSRGEPQMSTLLKDTKSLSDREVLRQWIEREAARGGRGGG